MHSLHWILALTLLHYLTAAPVEKRQEKTNTVIHENTIRLQTAKCVSVRHSTRDSTFYSASSIQTECMKTALRCASKELIVAAEECLTDDDFSFSYQTSNLINNMLPPEDTNEAVNCTACENYPKKPYKEFISDLKSLVEMFNSST